MTTSTSRRRLVADAAITLTFGMAACGSSKSQKPPSAQQLFVTNCSACHSLSGSERPSRQGGDLRALRISPAAMLQFVREMPVRHHLKGAQNDLVAKYVLAIERAARGG